MQLNKSFTVSNAQDLFKHLSPPFFKVSDLPLYIAFALEPSSREINHVYFIFQAVRLILCPEIQKIKIKVHLRNLFLS